MKKHIKYAIQVLQETYLDFSSFQEDIELLIDVAKGKMNHLLDEGACLGKEGDLNYSASNCRVCQAISRLEAGSQ